MPTHEVINQPPPYGGFNLFATDPVLTEGVARWVPPTEQTAAELDRLGALAGSDEAAAWADRAQTNLPRLITHDRWGHRVDEVVFDPAWHELMRTAVEAGLTADPWVPPAGRGAHVRRAAA